MRRDVIKMWLQADPWSIEIRCTMCLYSSRIKMRSATSAVSVLKGPVG